MKNFTDRSYNYYLIFFFLLFNSLPSNAIGSELTVRLSNAISGKVLTNQKIVVYKKQSDGSLKWHFKKNTDAQGKIILDLPGLGTGTQYQFRANPYGTGYSFSDFVNAPGSFNFKVGNLEAKVIQGASGQILANHKVTITEQLAGGKSKWVASGLTDANGIIRFDAAKIGSGGKYVLHAISPFDNLTKHSNVLTQNGKVTFTVGNRLLTVRLTNAISGQILANQRIVAYQKQQNGSLKWFLKKSTDAKGKVVLDLPGLGAGIHYQFRANPYGTGFVYSDFVNTTNSFDFKVGRLEAKIVKGESGKPLANYKIAIREYLTNGNYKWLARGLTNANGIIRFDVDEMGSGKKYVLTATNPFDGKPTNSNVITKNGKVTFTVGNKLLTVNLTNAISGKVLANQKIVVYQKQTDGSLKWYFKKNTDAEGKIVLDLPGLGTGTQYQFRANSYGTGYAFSDFVNAPGTFNFKVGKLEAKVIQGASGQILANHKVTITEQLADGKSKWVASGLTDTNGIIRFDVAKMGGGKKYVLHAISPSDNLTKQSNVLTQNGKITFSVGNKLLIVRLSNAISGQVLANKEIKVFQQQADGLLKWVRKNFTNNQGIIKFDLDGLGNGTSYVLLTNVYGTVVKGKPITKPGNFDFKVGNIQVKLSDSNNNQRLINKKLSLLKKTSDGKLHWEAAINTDLQGLAHFDPIGLDNGEIYVVHAKNLFNKNKTFYSPWITSKGIINFSVSPDEDYSADLKPPEISFITPSEDAIVSDGGFDVKARINDNEEINSVDYKVFDPIKGTSTGSMKLVRGIWKFSVESSMITALKTAEVTITATDKSQNKAEVSRQFQIIKDTDGPTLNITSHRDHDQVSENGFLLSGIVKDNTFVKDLTASVEDPLLGKIVDKKPLEVSESSGSWALSVRKISRNSKIKISLDSVDFSGNKTTKQLTLNVMTNGLNGRRLIDRLTFGQNDELIEQIKTPSGAEVFLYEQLHPELIDNSELESILAEIGEPNGTIALQNHQLTRAIYSKRQLQEVMTWFWENHFNTDISKTGYARELTENKKFRKNALGNFRDLLQISATSPAMSIYLDNRFNHKSEPNENYARELLELHTLGVDGGYTQNDVAEVARVFTGWQRLNFEFYFRNSHHDDSEKFVLDSSIPAGLGKEGGEIILELLANHPSTAKFICTKLLKKFVTDSPNAISIRNCATDFIKNLDKNDQIARVLENIFRSDYFTARQHFHSKVKTPLEFIAGFVRQFSINLSYYDSNLALQSMGMPLFRNPLPTGWPEVGERWVNSDRYLQYFQFVNNSIFNRPDKSRSYIENPLMIFKNNGFETAEGIVGYLFNLALSNDYSNLEWDTAISILTENGKIDFDINDGKANDRIKKLLTAVLNFPAYQLQ